MENALFPWLRLRVPLNPWTFLCTKKEVECKSLSWVTGESLQPHGLQPSRLLCPWNSPGKNTGVGCHFLLQRIFLTQGWNPGLLHLRQILYHLNQQGSPSSLLMLMVSSSNGKQSAFNEGDWGLIPGSERLPIEGNGNPLQYSCLENSMDRGACRATIHGVTKSWTWLNDLYYSIAKMWR